MKNHLKFLKKTIKFIICLSFLTSCSNGLQQLKKGRFDEAIFTSMERLKKNPDHKKAFSVLRESYPRAINDHKRAINIYENSQESFRWEKILAEYQALNQIYDIISHSAVNMRIMGAPQNFGFQAETARQLAAGERYQAGELALANKENRLAAKDALGQFERANQLIPNYKNANLKAKEAFQYALHRVVFEPVYDVFSLQDREYFKLQNALDREIFDSKPINQFVRFYTTASAREEIFSQNDLVKFSFLNLSAPLRDVNTTIEHYTSEIKVGTKKINDSTKVDVFEKVYAKITTYKKSIVVRGTMQMRVTDFRTKALLNEETEDESYCWTDSWQVFEGNPKALPDGQACPPTSSPILNTEPSRTFFFNRISDQFAHHFKRSLQRTYRNM